MSISNYVDVIRCKSAQEFVDALMPTSGHFHDDHPNTWLFRGHKRWDFKLVPSALRSEESMAQVVISKCDSNQAQIESELKILSDFHHIADLRGLPLPEGWQSTRELVQRLSGYIGFQEFLYKLEANEASWPPTELLPLVGLAQHYGLPTRLLDWTYDPFIAAYFAAKSVVEDAHSAESQRQLIKRYCSIAGTKFNKMASNLAIMGDERRLAVWAFSTSIANAFRHHPTIDTPYEIVSVPYSDNPYIAAQQGLFTLLRSKLEASSTVNRNSFDETLVKCAKEVDLLPNQHTLFLRLELEWEHAFELLRLLAKIRVNASTVFPGFRGVCDTVAEKRWWWDKQD